MPRSLSFLVLSLVLHLVDRGNAAGWVLLLCLQLVPIGSRRKISHRKFEARSTRLPADDVLLDADISLCTIGSRSPSIKADDRQEAAPRCEGRTRAEHAGPSALSIGDGSERDPEQRHLSTGLRAS
jgi:hypothetical protein